MFGWCIVLMMVVVLVELRGPHHPRGELVKRHIHYIPNKNAHEKLTQDTNLIQDKEHIHEHLDQIIEEPDLSKMSEKDLEFYYFQVHDTDKNTKLDGLELLQAIYHTEHDVEQDDNKEERKPNFEFYIEMIDLVLMEDDLNKDGFLSYLEYTTSRKKVVKNNNSNDSYVMII